MLYTFRGHVNWGAYDQPFSGVGVAYYPLGVAAKESTVTLHESGYLPDNAHWNYPSVFSPFWRLYYNLDEGHCLLLRDGILELTPDKLVLIPDHVFFHCLGENPVRTFWMAFSSGRKLHQEIEAPVELSPRDTELCLIRDLQELISANTNWTPTETIYNNSLALLHVVMSRPELSWKPPPPRNLLAIVKHIEHNYASPLPNAELARRAGMSVESFARTFKKHFSTTPADFVTRTRVREASRLLLKTLDSIESIAEATGFPNRSYFSRVFAKVTGEPPASFRKAHSLLGAKLAMENHYGRAH